VAAVCLPDHRGISLRVLVAAAGRQKSGESESLGK
jgi:hypothetical protein